jgi:hypothetical protein
LSSDGRTTSPKNTGHSKSADLNCRSAVTPAIAAAASSGASASTSHRVKVKRWVAATIRRRICSKPPSRPAGSPGSEQKTCDQQQHRQRGRSRPGSVDRQPPCGGAKATALKGLDRARDTVGGEQQAGRNDGGDVVRKSAASNSAVAMKVSASPRSRALRQKPANRRNSGTPSAKL